MPPDKIPTGSPQPIWLRQVIGVQVRSARLRRGWSLQDLADRMEALDFSTDRSAISRLERGAEEGAPARAQTRSDNISVREWLTLAVALDVPPLSLLLPVKEGGVVNITAALKVDTNIALWWIAGEEPLASVEPDGNSYLWNAEPITKDGRAARIGDLEVVAPPEAWREAARDVWFRRELRGLQRRTEGAWALYELSLTHPEPGLDRAAEFERARDVEVAHRRAMAAAGVKVEPMPPEFEAWTRPQEDQR